MMHPFSRLMLAFVLAGVAAHAQTSHWPTQDGNYVIQNFRFGSGESIPEAETPLPHLG